MDYGLSSRMPGTFLAEVSFKWLANDLYIQSSQLSYAGSVGEGEFAIVERAFYQPASGPPMKVAVKSFKPHVVANYQELKEVVFAAQLLARLQHPHVCRFLGLGGYCMDSNEALNASLFFVEELMPGGNLQELLAAQMRQPNTPLYSHHDTFRWCIQLASALAYLHQHDPCVVHGDVTCKNLFLTLPNVQAANVKLVDLKAHKHIYFHSPTEMAQRVARIKLPQYSLARQAAAAAGEEAIDTLSLGRDDSAHGGSLAASNPSNHNPSQHSPTNPVSAASPSAQAGAAPPSQASSDFPVSSRGGQQVVRHSGMQHSKSLPSKMDELAAAGDSDYQSFSDSAEDIILDVDGTADTALQPTSHRAEVSRTSDDRWTINARSESSAQLSRSPSRRSVPPVSGPRLQRTSSEPIPLQHSPEALHMMERKRHGASNAFHALTAITSINEETPGITAGLSGRDPDGKGTLFDRSHSGHAQPKQRRSSTYAAWSKMYAAPEIIRGHKYNEKADVFSFGVVLYELLTRSLLTCWADSDDLKAKEVAMLQYAERVAAGYREALPDSWPDTVRELVAACWAPDPHERPRMADVQELLVELAADPALMQALVEQDQQVDQQEIKRAGDALPRQGAARTGDQPACCRIS